MQHLTDQLRRFALDRGHWEPTLFLDDGAASRGPKPALDELLAQAAAGLRDAVFVPGLWVFSIDDDAARATAAQLEAYGCRVFPLLHDADLPELQPYPGAGASAPLLRVVA
ncbi:hypothetical protein [Kitasatospora terrestris]|uniref:hypothetical protein n=1 Tax=Kitasatospora terrestris TaxID=258051 RepID=UPI0031EFD7B6